MSRQRSAILEWLTQKLGPRHSVPAPADPPPLEQTPRFTADFCSQEQWVAGRSWAYPDGGPTNPGDDKLDHLVPDAEYCRSGAFRASRRHDGRWNAGLLTTEESAGGFTVRTGDTLETRVRLPVEAGAWPAIWTWRDGGNEIDVFEYHPDNPDLLELSNHVRGGHHYYTHPSIHPGAWVDLKVEFRARSVIWWVNGIRAYADGNGVGRDWYAYLIVNLSVSAGQYHPAPEPGVNTMAYEVDHLRVYSPASR
ncbi:family 16 glycosylhydrolase [Streptomyces sp. H10-C2]|uniref:glycoside hydrolase family 16 protein n=1 Tax=unclassified Streptomyces TaxID=2593676 RepID=UPI0024BB1F4D|nr:MULTISPECIES: family 16 glycosylhydrolase [unclassified Streptomyces]MDJ0343430.1 family 16 glycosylhydrolase [Streptomyces sp. PH10-H1]MDJ0371510.1 family 16 glycosylhydrolase [Streptomyces sp. H10-C2]